MIGQGDRCPPSGTSTRPPPRPRSAYTLQPDGRSLKGRQRVAVYLTPNPNSKEGAQYFETGGKAVAHRSIAVKDGTIVAVGAPDRIARDYQAARTVDARGRYVMPGLWDMHVHFGGGPELIEENRNLLPVYVAYGITAVRDCAADISDAVLQWRDQVATGALLGPTIFTSGPKLEGTSRSGKVRSRSAPRRRWMPVAASCQACWTSSRSSRYLRLKTPKHVWCWNV